MTKSIQAKNFLCPNIPKNVKVPIYLKNDKVLIDMKMCKSIQAQNFISADIPKNVKVPTCNVFR